MRRNQLCVLVLLGSMFLDGCVEMVPSTGGKTVTCVSHSDVASFLKTLGYANNYSASLSRSSSGDRLFVHFDNHTNAYSAMVNYFVAIVSSNEIVVKDLPGMSYLNDDGDPVCWLTWQGKTSTIHFANGYTLATNEHWLGASDGKFIPMFRDKEDHWWIARVGSPLREIVTFDWNKQFELLASHENKLDVFVRGAPDGKARLDNWYVLKRYEYEIKDDKAQLIKVQDFYFTWAVLDFDPDNNLMLAGSWDTVFAHAILVDTFTGKRKDLRRMPACGYFLDAGVTKRFKQAVQGK